MSEAESAALLARVQRRARWSVRCRLGLHVRVPVGGDAHGWVCYRCFEVRSQ